MGKITALLIAALCSGAALAHADGLYSDFANPPRKYLPMPLWHLNGTLTTEIIEDQMTKAVKESGFGGFCLLPVRTTKPDYLSEAYFARYEDMLKTAKRLGMSVVFYDDTDYPTGTAGGKFQARFPNDTVKQLNKIERIVQGPVTIQEPVPAGSLMSVVAMETSTLTRIDLTHSVANGSLFASLPEGNWRLMYFVCVPSGRNLVDFLDKDSTEKFLSLTYEECYTRFSEYFGDTIFMTFFDDVAFPQTGGTGGYRMWTHSFNDTFKKKFGYSPTSLYPALWYDIGEKTGEARVALHRTRADMLGENWVHTIADWAKAHDVVSIGHPMDNYNPQAVNCSGDNLKFYKYMDCPLMDSIHYYGQGRDGFKQIGSASYNYDKPVTVVEIYGNYPDSSFDANMLYRSGMELFVRGANFFLPHGTWLEPEKIYIPPEISWRNPRLKDALPKYNPWAARISSMLQAGRHVADIGILYPIASLQANYILDEPQKHGSRFGLYTYPTCDFQELSRFLVETVRRDFTFVHPEVIDEKCEIVGNKLHLNNKVNFEDYKAFIIPGGNTIHWSNLQKIKAFYDNGGTVIGTTELPKYAAEGAQYNADVQATIHEIFGETASLQNQPRAETLHIKIDVQGNTFRTFIDDELVDVTTDNSFATGTIGIRVATDEKALVDNVVVSAENGDVLFSEDFSNNFDKWVNVDTNTVLENGVLQIFENQNFQAKDGKDWKNCSVSCDILPGSNVAGIAFRAQDTDNLYMWQIRPQEKLLCPHKKVKGGYTKMKSVSFKKHDADAPVTEYVQHINAKGGKAFFVPNPTAATLRQILDSAVDAPDIAFAKEFKVKPANGMGMLSYLEKVKDGKKFWFVANSTDEPISAPITLQGKLAPKIWDPYTGKVENIGFNHTRNGENDVTELTLVLPPVTALFLVVDDK